MFFILILNCTRTELGTELVQAKTKGVDKNKECYSAKVMWHATHILHL